MSARDARRRSRELAAASPKAAASPSADVEAIADDLVRDLFTCGSGATGARLAIVNGDGRELAGWGPIAIRDRVLTALHKARGIR